MTRADKISRSIWPWKKTNRDPSTTPALNPPTVKLSNSDFVDRSEQPRLTQILDAAGLGSDATGPARVRITCLAIAAFQAFLICSDLLLQTGPPGLTYYHLVGLLAALAGAGATWEPYLSEYWRLGFVIFGATITIIFGLISIARADVVPMLGAAVLIAGAAAALLPWSSRWQAGLSLTLLAIVVVFHAFLVHHEPAANRYWGALVVGLLLAQMVAFSIERSHGVVRGYIGALVNAQERQRAILENTRETVMVFSVDGLILELNPAACRLLGVAHSDDAIGRSVYDFGAPEGRAIVRDFLDRVVAEGSAQAEFEVTAPEGDRHWADATGVMLRDRAGSVSILAVSHDVTAYKLAQAELATARDAALESARAKSAFLANMSHEIRTPINVILGYSEIVADHLAERGEQSQRPYLDAIVRAGRSLLETIGQILDFSRLEAGAVELRPARIDLAALAARHVQDLGILAAPKGLELSCRIDEPAPQIFFDEYCLSNALTNLLQNAIKFTEKGKVALRLYRDPARALCIDVSDTGIGIDAAYIARLYEPFSQEQSGYDRRFQGAGLGLALSRRYLELNGAQLTVRSEKGAGSVFTIRFPRSAELAPQEQPAAQAQPK